MQKVYAILTGISKKPVPSLVINFYELLTGLTYFFFRPAVPQICIGHQYLFLHNQFKLPKKNKCSLFFLNFFTRLTALGASQKTGPLLPFHARRQSSAHQRGSSFVATRRIAAGKQTR